MGQRSHISVSGALFASLVLGACGNDGAAPETTASATTDYSEAAHWLSLPATIKAVDVFYLYPTAWRKNAPTDPNICDIDNASMLVGSNAAFGRQATAFDVVGNVYAPYYRQADAIYTLSLPPDEREALVGGLPTSDAVGAFAYYVTHYNNGRPYILVAHSQGANVMMNLLAGYLRDNPEVYGRMIAAYVIGYSVTDAYLAKNTHLRFATGPDDTGVIISYNTQSPDVATGGNPVVLPGALAINPVTWTTEETLAPKAEGLGSFMPVAGTLTQVPQYADARVDKAKGALITTADQAGLTLGFGPGIFHSYDYLFYYYNLRDNAANRVAKFLSK